MNTPTISSSQVQCATALLQLHCDYGGPHPLWWATPMEYLHTTAKQWTLCPPSPCQWHARWCISTGNSSPHQKHRSVILHLVQLNHLELDPPPFPWRSSSFII